MNILCGVLMDPAFHFVSSVSRQAVYKNSHSSSALLFLTLASSLVYNETKRNYHHQDYTYLCSPTANPIAVMPKQIKKTNKHPVVQRFFFLERDSH